MAEQRLRILLELIDKLSGPMTKASGSTEQMRKKSKLLDGVLAGVGMQLTSMATQLPGMAVQMLELGAQAEAARYRFARFAGGAAEAEKLLAAFQRGTEGATSELDAMSSAARLLQMDLVGNADEMELVAAMATKLGDQTMGAGQRIGDFAMMLVIFGILRATLFTQP